MPVVIAALLASGAQAQPAQQSAPAVIVLPFAADATVSLKQAEGATAQVRRAVTPAVAKLLSAAPDDVKQAERCARDLACLRKVAEQRGADLLGVGVVSPAPDGLRVSLVVVSATDALAGTPLSTTAGASAGPAAAGVTQALRRVEITLQGNDADARRLERLVRLAFNPSALRGWLSVKGEEGALLEIDGVLIGALPLAPVADFLEGDHVVVVRKDGSGEFRRSVGVTHGETTEVKALLVVTGDEGDASVAAAGETGAAPVDAIVVGAIGGGLLVLGGVAGALSLRESLDIEARAATQNLAFPTDAERYGRGNLLALTANGLYLGGAVAIGAAVVLLVLE